MKETLSGRKNSSPQNTYETSQLYAVGALKVACVGLQCVGFNQTVYKSVLDHAVKFGQTKWKSLTTASANVLAAAGDGVQPGPKISSVANRSRTPNRTKLSMATPSLSNLSPALTTSGLGPGSSTWNTTGIAACANVSTQRSAASSTDKSTITAKESDEKS